MGYWNYRVVRRRYPDAANPEERDWLEVHRAHYRIGETKPYAFAVNPAVVEGHSIEEIAAELAKFREALSKPVLDFDTREPITLEVDDGWESHDHDGEGTGERGTADRHPPKSPGRISEAG